MSSLLSALRGPSVTNEPPNDQDIRRSDIAVIVWLVFVLFLGIGIRNNSVNASKSFDLGENLPSLNVPANWIRGQSEALLLRARNPRSASTFDAELNVAARALNPDENLVSARTGLSVRRSRELTRYREFSAEGVQVLGGEPAILVTYAYIADPTREAGAVAPPVVIQAQDLVFVLENQVFVVTVAADATEWDEAYQDFKIVFDSLRFKEGE